MREILFKAKRSNWEGLPKEEWWVKGYLMDENYINVPFNDYDVGGRFDEPIEIDTETVCEYTGLTDKNGRKIFEGDILKRVLLPTKRIENNFRITFVPVKSCFSAVDLDGSNVTFVSDYINKNYEIEIIGNIFDNPELLGK